MACPAIRYATPDDRQKFDIVQSIRTLTLLREEHPEKRRGGRFHFRTPAEMATACKDHPDWLRHTQEIAERCNFDLPFGKPQFPAFTPPDGSPPSEFLRRLVLQGLRERYGPRAEQFQPQVMEELGIINEVGYEEYFLITWDFLQECRRRGIEWITRGSAADCLVCYCLGISGVCPIRFDLYFRRFLNKERMALHKLPDIDIDFAHDFKDDVVKLIFEKYGREHCAVVGGFSTFQARSAFAEVAKVLGVAEREVRKFTDHFPWSFGGGWVPDEHTPSGGAGLIEMLRASPENRDLPFDEEPYRTALEMAEFLDGVPRYPKMHPCGLVLSRQPMHELTPTFIANKGYATTHFDMDAVEAIGLVKMDILAQGGLAAMRDVKAMLDQRGIEVDLERCVARDKSDGRLLLGNPQAPEPWQDPQVWEMIASGGARAVHHIESPAMTSLCRMCNVREIDGLIAIVSVIRPGAANEGKKLAFTRRYQGLEPVTYPHPSLEACLRSTYGLVVYEEHILQLCEAFAGLPSGPGGRVAPRAQQAKPSGHRGNPRRVLSNPRGHAATRRKKSPKCGDWSRALRVTPFARRTARRMASRRINPRGSRSISRSNSWRRCCPTAKAFIIPWFMCWNVIGSESNSCRRPSISPARCSCRRDSSSACRCVTSRDSLNAPMNAILTERDREPFPSLADFFRRVAASPEEMESLLRVGAFDEFGRTRTAQFWECQFLQRPLAARTVRGRACLLPPPGLDRLPEVPLAEPTRRERLESENELLGFPVERPSAGTARSCCLGHLLPGVAPGRTRRRTGGDVRAGGGTTHPPSNHGRADEIPDAGRLDGHGGNRVVRADLSQLRAGDRAVSGAGNRGHSRAVRERAGIFVAGVAGGETTNEYLGDWARWYGF